MRKSKYLEIKQYLMQNIATGLWPEGHLIPSENQLSEQFNVSRMTARRALQEMADEGILQRTQGAATCVAPLKHQSSLLEIHNIADEIQQRGQQHKAKVLHLATIDQTTPTQDTFSFGTHTCLERLFKQFEQPPQQLSHSVICHYEDNIAIQLEERFVNTDLVPHYLEQDFCQTTPHEYLCRIAPLAEAEHIIQAITPQAAVQYHLDIANSQPCLQIQRRTWSVKGTVSYAILTHPGQRYQLGGRLNLTRI